MNLRSLQLILVAVVVLLLGSTNSLHASRPAFGNQNVRYINPDYTYTYYYTGLEYYVKDTLPNEWYPSWPSETLKAGAVIIRSGAYWRTNRSYLNATYPNNNCYQGTVTLSDGSLFEYYRTAPNSRGGQEQWIPNSYQAASSATATAAVDATSGIHADRVSIPSGRPDAFVPHRYNSTIQNRTNTCTGTYVQKLRCAYVNAGNPFDPNVECSQTDDITSTDPIYTSN